MTQKVQLKPKFYLEFSEIIKDIDFTSL